jgi:hypothetical protein
MMPFTILSEGFDPPRISCMKKVNDVVIIVGLVIA